MLLNQENILNKINPKNSYLISGPSGCGKTSLALEIIKRTIEDIDPKNSFTFPLNYPDYHYLLGGNVEDIKELLVKLNQKPYYKKHFVLLDEINKLSIEGQNLLLKTLEESDVFFVLVSNDNTKVLNTLFSRTYKITPVLFKEEDMLSLINARYNSNENYSIGYAKSVSKLSTGSLGKAIKYIENPIYKEFIEELENISTQNFFLLSNKYKDYKEERDEFFFLIESHIRNMMIFSNKRNDYFNLVVTLDNYKKDLLNNANIQMIYQNVFSELIRLSK